MSWSAAEPSNKLSPAGEGSHKRTRRIGDRDKMVVLKSMASNDDSVARLIKQQELVDGLVKLLEISDASVEKATGLVVRLIGDNAKLLLLAVGTGKVRAGCRPISVVCIRGNIADADTRPLYKCVLTVAAAPAYKGDLGASLTLNGTVASCSFPGNVDMEEGWFHLIVHPKMMHGDSKEVHLGICIAKLTVHH